MSILGIITDEGVSKSIDLQNEEGFKIVPYKFAVTETLGAFLPSRTVGSILPTWYEGLISSAERISSNTVQFSCNIPAGASPEARYTKEVYVFAKDEFDQDFLLGLAQPTSELTYDPDGELKVRIQFTIANINISELYEFKYTQATEISDHNSDVNAHPVIQTAMNKAGIYVQQAQNRFNGQMFDGFPVVSPIVINKDAVFFNKVTNRYEQALAGSGDERAYPIGVYDADLNIVISKGIIDYPNSLAPYSPIYLSTTIAGAITAAPSNSIIGRTLPNNRLMIGIELESVGVDNTNFDGDVTVNLLPPLVRELTLKDSNNILWDVRVDEFGLLYTVPNSLREEDIIFRIPKIDLSSAQLKVKTNGELFVESPPSNSGALLDAYFYLQAPDGVNWKISVNLLDEIVMQSYQNAFLVRSENSNHFAVKQTSRNFALMYGQIYDVDSLPLTPPTLDGLLPFCFYTDGVNTRPIFYDGLSWKYVHDNSAV